MSFGVPRNGSSAHVLPVGRIVDGHKIKWKRLTDFDKRKTYWNERENRWVTRDYQRIWIDVSKLDAMLRLNPSEYVGFAGKNGIDGKYSGVDEFLRSGKDTLQMPKAGIQSLEKNHNRNSVYIRDGRHRFAWMRDHGALALPVTVPVDELDDIARLVGTTLRICQVTMQYIPERCHGFNRDGIKWI